MDRDNAEEGNDEEGNDEEGNDELCHGRWIYKNRLPIWFTRKASNHASPKE